MRGLLCTTALVAAAAFLPSLARAAAPANDAFAAAEVVSGPSGSVTGTRDGATVEPGEPAPMPQYHSVWYAWTAPAYGTLSFDTAGTAWAWVFTGDTLGTAAMKINGQRYGFVSVQPGVTYRIGLDDWNDGGPVQLSWSFGETPAPPANDDFANAQPLDGTGGTVGVDTAGATKEACESTLGNGHSLWFSYVPSVDGELTVQAITDVRGTIAAVFTGDSVCGLTQQAQSGGDPAVANVLAGRTYWIELDTWTDAGGPTSFRWSFASPARPVNDNFANALVLDPAGGTVTGNGLHATPEPGEWTPFFGHTVWYAWTPAQSGVGHVDFQLGDGVVYTGTSLDTLTSVAYDGATFNASAGVTYWIQVASSGDYQVRWGLEPSSGPTVSLAPASGQEGSPINLVATADDPSGGPLAYEWSTSLGTIEPHGNYAVLTVGDGPSVATVQVTVTDAFGSRTASEDVVVDNVAPSVTAPAASGVWGLPLSLLATVTDPSAADTAAGFTTSWSTGTATPTYADPGTYKAAFTATDKDGGTTTVSVPVTVGKRPSALAYAGSTTASFGFGSLGARFGDRSDAATAKLAGRSVSVISGPIKQTVKTDATGLATALVGSALMPGSYAVKASFSGDSLYTASSTGGRLTVVNSAGKVNGDVTLSDGTPVAFAVSGDGTTERGSFSAGSFVATSVAALGIAGDTAWFAGAAADGTPFVAKVTDAGEPGAGRDVVTLWIGGVLQPASGTIATGNVQLHG
jgi:hypothetical protein